MLLLLLINKTAHRAGASSRVYLATMLPGQLMAPPAEPTQVEPAEPPALAFLDDGDDPYDSDDPDSE